MRRALALSFALAAIAVSSTAPCPLCAQAPDTPPQPNLYTFHVYTNLMQFPTIVLSQDLNPVPPVAREDFAVSIDRGPVFHPTQMRIEGDDPLSLAILLDAGGEQKDVLEAFTRSFSRLVPGYLHPRDRVSIYAMDCTVFRSLNAATPDAGTLDKGIADALSAPGLHGDKAKGGCGYGLHLWDAVLQVAQDIGASPSRRVILVVSRGRERASKTSFAVLNSTMNAKGIAVFGLRDNLAYRRDTDPQVGNNLVRTWGDAPGSPLNEDLFAELCASNGGTILNDLPVVSLPGLEHFMDILRARYILEFPRPEDKTATTHSFSVTIPGSLALVRPTGGWSPIPDPSIAADPSTVPITPSPAKAGKRHHIGAKT